MMTADLLRPVYTGQKQWLQVGGVHVGVPSSPPTYRFVVKIQILHLTNTVEYGV